MVARADNSLGIVGVAPDATLLPLRACWPDQADSDTALCSSFTLASHPVRRRSACACLTSVSAAHAIVCSSV